MSPILTAALIIGLLLITQAFGARSYAPWVPSRKRDFSRIFKLAALRPGEVFYDLGCGDGRVVFAASRLYQARAMGFEYSIPLFVVCKLRQVLNWNGGASFKFKNLYRADLSQADVLYCFGVPETLRNNLLPKLKAQAKPGARVISYGFFIEGLQPEVIDRPGPNDLPIYLYRF